MRRVLVDNSFKRDLKKLQKRGTPLKRLYAYVVLLQKNESLPPIARPHKLSGEYDGCWECHIESDWLLIYEIAPSAIILNRTGSHADLFE